VSDSFLPEGDRYLNGEIGQALRKITVPVVIGVTANDGLAALGEQTFNKTHQQIKQYKVL